MNTEITMSLNRGQMTILINLVITEIQHMRNRVSLEDRTPLFQERLDNLEWLLHVLTRTVMLARLR